MNTYSGIKNYFLTNYEEEAFLRLFEKVLRKTRLKTYVSDEEISNGVNCAIENFKGGLADACAVGNFTSPGSLLGYFYWSAPLSAGLARHKVRIAMYNCKEFQSKFLQQSLKIVSVGGGTGSDLVGLCSAIYETSAFHEVEITVVDNNWRWKPFFKTTERLLREENFGDASHLFKSKSVKTSYICADLSDRSCEAYTNALMGADIIWMKGVRSILRNETERREVTETVISSMSPGALLVVMDPLCFDNFEMHHDGIERVFTSRSNKQYTFMPTSANKYGRGPCKSSNQEIIVFVKNSDSYEMYDMERNFLF